MTKYTLIRALPNGTEKSSGPFKTVRAAVVAAGQCLFDNGAASKAEAQQFSARMNTTLGVTTRHSSGYAFRLESTK